MSCSLSGRQTCTILDASSFLQWGNNPPQSREYALCLTAVNQDWLRLQNSEIAGSLQTEEHKHWPVVWAPLPIPRSSKNSRPRSTIIHQKRAQSPALAKELRHCSLTERHHQKKEVSSVTRCGKLFESHRHSSGLA